MWSQKLGCPPPAQQQGQWAGPWSYLGQRTIWSQNQLRASGKVASPSAPSFLWAPAPWSLPCAQLPAYHSAEVAELKMSSMCALCPAALYLEEVSRGSEQRALGQEPRVPGLTLVLPPPGSQLLLPARRV